MADKTNKVNMYISETGDIQGSASEQPYEVSVCAFWKELKKFSKRSWGSIAEHYE